MARRAVVLNRTLSDETTLAYRLLMWIPVPEAQRVPAPDFVSAYPLDLPNQPTATELEALRSGAWREHEVNLGIEKHTAQGVLRTESQLWAAFRDYALHTYTLLSTSQSALLVNPSLYGTTYDEPGGWQLRQGPEPVVAPQLDAGDELVDDSGLDDRRGRGEPPPRVVLRRQQRADSEQDGE